MLSAEEGLSLQPAAKPMCAAFSPWRHIWYRGANCCRRGLSEVSCRGCDRSFGVSMKKAGVSKKPASRRAAQKQPAGNEQKLGPGPAQDIQVRIAARAHQLYEQRGCLDGYHLHDWLEAEREILGHPLDKDKSSERI